ncbi:MAG: site-specific integrase, partial [Hyphomicrobiaceae bacterium]|nr:site-specific integrase [Hyphomicrobiaceae bacterium]
IIDVLDDIVRGGSGTQANKAQSLISAVFTWAIAEERVENNPAYRIPKRVPERARERVCSHDELRKLWRAFDATINGRPDAAPVTPQIARALQLLILTALRRSEVAGARRSEFEGSTWVIPSERMKAKRQHIVMLPPLAAQIVRDAAAESKHPELLFPGRENRELDANSVTRAMMRTCKRLGINGLSVHALRRTAASEMGRLQVAPEIIERVLAHTPSGVTMKHYNLHSYAPEKLAALLRWQNALSHIIESETTSPA